MSEVLAVKEIVLLNFLKALHINLANCQAQVQVQVPGQVQKVQGLRTKDLDLG